MSEDARSILEQLGADTAPLDEAANVLGTLNEGGIEAVATEQLSNALGAEGLNLEQLNAENLVNDLASSSGIIGTIMNAVEGLLGRLKG